MHPPRNCPLFLGYVIAFLFEARSKWMLTVYFIYDDIVTVINDDVMILNIGILARGLCQMRERLVSVARVRIFRRIHPVFTIIMQQDPSPLCCT